MFFPRFTLFLNVHVGLRSLAINFVRVIVPDPELEVIMYELHQSWVIVRYKNNTNHPISNNNHPSAILI